MIVRLITIDEAYNLILHPTFHEIGINKDPTKNALFSGKIEDADRLYCEGKLHPKVFSLLQMISNPTPEQYQKGLARQYKICKTKTHKKGFTFWNEYKKSKGKI